mmetsp:Transcript_60732/g.146815  ORF Transcript_60732/g.146815 Transcript_60732/m.146815 type:complete len:98 (+) Transcript_60732:2-295(+)
MRLKNSLSVLIKKSINLAIILFVKVTSVINSTLLPMVMLKFINQTVKVVKINSLVYLKVLTLVRKLYYQMIFVLLLVLPKEVQLLFYLLVVKILMTC